MRAVVSTFMAIVIAGCVSVSSLPNGANEVNFVGTEGKTGWSEYRESARFRNVDIPAVYDAAKAGLASAEFALVRADQGTGVVKGEHGITWHDWNVVAGIYMKQDGPDVLVRVIVEGSKDTGFSGDVTGDNWTGKILFGMREYLREFGER